jgi:hypothetical protein
MAVRLASVLDRGRPVVIAGSGHQEAGGSPAFAAIRPGAAVRPHHAEVEPGEDPARWRARERGCRVPGGGPPTRSVRGAATPLRKRGPPAAGDQRAAVRSADGGDAAVGDAHLVPPDRGAGHPRSPGRVPVMGSERSSPRPGPAGPRATRRGPPHLGEPIRRGVKGWASATYPDVEAAGQRRAPRGGPRRRRTRWPRAGGATAGPSSPRRCTGR